MGWIWRGGGQGGGSVDVELPVNTKVLWDGGADKIQLNKPNGSKAAVFLTKLVSVPESHRLWKK